MSSIDPRKSELTATHRRDLFDACPEDVTTDEDRARWKDFVYRYSRASNLDNDGDFPLQLDFELNAACNLRCSFCVHGQRLVKERRLDRDIYEAAILEGEKFGLVSVKLNYINEPLLVPDLADYIRFARDHGVLNVYLATNGLLLTAEKSRELIDAGLTKVMVSIDASSSKTYLLMRGSKRYDEVEHNVREFVRVRNEMGKRFPLMRVNFLQTAGNVGEADAFLKKWDNVADMVGFQQQVARPDSDDVTMRGNEPFGCSFPFKLMVIDSGGLVLPCCTFSGREMPLGSATDLSIHKAWTSEAMVTLRDQHRRLAYQENPICKHCIEGSSKDDSPE